MYSKNKQYQFNYSSIHSEAMYNRDVRYKKAQTMLAVLKHYYSKTLENFSVLDIGSSTGIIANALSHDFGYVIGVDIDEPAIHYASNQFRGRNIRFFIADSMDLAIKANYFDVVICAQIYEHVPRADRLMTEIHRVLKPGGVCYFAAGNRLRLIEPHYSLPFLSIIPRKLSHTYIRLAGKGNSYYEKHYSYWGLKRLIFKFECIDYTQRIIEKPSKYNADYLIPGGSAKKKVAEFIIKYVPWLSPGYVWLLKKVIF